MSAGIGEFPGGRPPLDAGNLSLAAQALGLGSQVAERLTTFLVNGASYNVADYGASPSATPAQNVIAVRACVAAAGIGGRIVSPSGILLLNDNIQLLDFQQIVGYGFYIGSGGSPRAAWQWQGLAAGQPGLSCGVNNTFSFLQFRGMGGTGNTSACVQSLNGHPTFNWCGFYSSWYGCDIQNAYYATFNNCEWAYNKTHVLLTSCYNVKMLAPRFSGSFATAGYFSNCIRTATSVRNLQIFGGSMEGYDSSGGVQLAAGSLLSIFGTYFESSEATSASFGVVCLAGGSTVNLLGCEVYLSNANRWFNASALDNIVLNAHGNRFECSAGSVTNPIAYVLPTNTTGGSVDVSGDSWDGVLLAAASYCGGTFNGGAVNRLRIVPPTGATAFLAAHEFVARPMVHPKQTAVPANPIVGGMYYADGVTWDPLAKATGKGYFVTYNGAAFVALA